MNLREFEVYGVRTSNLVRACNSGGCPVTVNANLDANSFPPSRITDGRLETFIHHTANNNPWTMIDLGQTVFVSMVRIFNRVDWCSELFVNFALRVGNSATFSNNPACALNQPTFADNKDFPCMLTGRYFSIQQPFGNLHLREIEVFGRIDSQVCPACLAGTFKSAAGSAACAVCVAGKFSLTTAATTCADCVAGKYSATSDASVGDTCLDCGAGTYSGALDATAASSCTGCSVKYHASNFITDTFAKYPPHHVASAVGWDTRKAEFQDWIGNARVGRVTAGAASVGGVSGNGAGAGVRVPLVGGSTTASMNWGASSVPSTFTACSVSRYSGATRGRILSCSDLNWLNGHWNAFAGATFYNKDMFLQYTISPNTNWVVVCGRNV
jgi:hypothetical protein